MGVLGLKYLQYIGMEKLYYVWSRQGSCLRCHILVEGAGIGGGPRAREGILVYHGGGVCVMASIDDFFEQWLNCSPGCSRPRLLLNYSNKLLCPWLPCLT